MSRRYAPKCARGSEFAHICAAKQSRTKSLGTNIVTIPINMPTNFELKRLKPKLDIAKKPENRVHELTDSNVSLSTLHAYRAFTQVPFNCWIWELAVGTLLEIVQVVTGGLEGFSATPLSFDN